MYYTAQVDIEETNVEDELEEVIDFPETKVEEVKAQCCFGFLRFISFPKYILQDDVSIG